MRQNSAPNVQINDLPHWHWDEYLHKTTRITVTVPDDAQITSHHLSPPCPLGTRLVALRGRRVTTLVMTGKLLNTITYDFPREPRSCSHGPGWFRPNFSRPRPRSHHEAAFIQPRAKSSRNDCDSIHRGVTVTRYRFLEINSHRYYNYCWSEKTCFYFSTRKCSLTTDVILLFTDKLYWNIRK